MVMRNAALLLFVTVAAGAPPITPPKLGLIPGLWPWERRALEKRVEPLLKQGKDIRPVLLAAHVHPGVVRRMAEVTSGPLLRERYAHALVFSAKDLSDRQRRLFERVVPATEAAQRALWVHGEKMRKSIAEETLRKRVEASLKQQINAIEIRFWRIVNYALRIDQKASLKKLYPEGYNNPPNILGHVYQLPGLTASQASKITALVREFESENAADAAEGARLARKLAGAKLTDEGRGHLQRAQVELGDRAAHRLKRIIEMSLPIYTPDQIEHVNALVPMVSPSDRGRHPGELFQGVQITPEQQRQGHELGQWLHERYQANQKELRARLGTMPGEIGEDSPQQLMMAGMQANAHAKNLAAMEAAGRRAVLEILTPGQVSNWVVSAP